MKMENRIEEILELLERRKTSGVRVDDSVRYISQNRLENNKYTPRENSDCEGYCGDCDSDGGGYCLDCKDCN